MSDSSEHLKCLESLPQWIPPPSNEDEYEDILSLRRGTSDLRWAAQEWSSSGSFNGSKAVPHEEIVSKVLSSKRVAEAVKSVTTKHNVSKAEVEKEVKEILQIMGHNLDISAIRKFAFTLPKVMKTIYNRVFVHRPGMERLRRALQDHPVVLLPTHRSYADFLLVSYLSFHYNLPFPVIAAGMDFYHMAYVGTLLRQSGAFYIRRSFMEDELYWAVFQEYVHILICKEQAPLEFFLEGTRSRTAKSLRPKLGLLGCVAEASWRHSTKDVLVVPINISYSRTLEEILYAYELLGVPKPKESTSGLFKAKNILTENYGDMYFHVGVPVSLSSLMDPQRCIGTFKGHQFKADGVVDSLNQIEMSVVDGLALYLLREQQRMAVISLFSLASHFLLHHASSRLDPLSYTDLSDHVISVVNFLLAMKKAGSARRSNGIIFACQLQHGALNDDTLKKSFGEDMLLHGNIVSVTDGGLVQPASTLPTKQTPGTEESSLVTNSALQHILLQHYANQSIHLLVRPALVLLAVKTQLKQMKGSLKGREVFANFQKLCLLFGHDFIFDKTKSRQDFEEGVSHLEACGLLQKSAEEIIFLNSATSSIGVLFSSCLEPYLLTYRTALTVASSHSNGGESVLVPKIQKAVEEAIANEDKKHYSALSLDIVKNSVRSLTKNGGLTTVKVTAETGTSVKLVPQSEVLSQLHFILTGENIPLAAIKLNAKL